MAENKIKERREPSLEHESTELLAARRIAQPWRHWFASFRAESQPESVPQKLLPRVGGLGAGNRLD
jgi:hypothetical protein